MKSRFDGAEFGFGFGFAFVFGRVMSGRRWPPQQTYDCFKPAGDVGESRLLRCCWAVDKSVSPT